MIEPNLSYTQLGNMFFGIFDGIFKSFISLDRHFKQKI